MTDSWIIYIGLYRFKVTQQADARLTVTGADEHDLSHLSEGQVQFVNILVENVAKPIGPFKLRYADSDLVQARICIREWLHVFRLNSLSYREMKNKLQAPVEMARDIVIRMSLDDRFVEAFRQQAEMNPPYPMSDDQKEVWGLLFDQV